MTTEQKPLNTMSLQELTDHYNNNLVPKVEGLKPIKLFSQKGVALERIEKIEAQLKSEAKAADKAATKAEKPAKAPKEKKVKEPKAPREKVDHKPTGAFAKLPEWIAFTSETDTEYRIRVRTKMVQKYGRPVDFEQKPMIASRSKVEELLSSVEK